MLPVCVCVCFTDMRLLLGICVHTKESPVPIHTYKYVYYSIISEGLNKINRNIGIAHQRGNGWINCSILQNRMLSSHLRVIKKEQGLKIRACSNFCKVMTKALYGYIYIHIHSTSACILYVATHSGSHEHKEQYHSLCCRLFIWGTGCL